MMTEVLVEVKQTDVSAYHMHSASRLLVIKELFYRYFSVETIIKDGGYRLNTAIACDMPNVIDLFESLGAH